MSTLHFVFEFVISLSVFNLIWISWYFYFELAEIRNSDSECLFNRKVFIKNVRNIFATESNTRVHSAGWSICSFTFTWEFFWLCFTSRVRNLNLWWDACKMESLLLSANYNFQNDYGVDLTTNARNQRSGGSTPESWGVGEMRWKLAKYTGRSVECHTSAGWPMDIHETMCYLDRGPMSFKWHCQQETILPFVK